VNAHLSIASIAKRAAALAGECRRAAMAAGLAILPALASSAAEPPRIDLIEWYPRYPDEVSIHFETQANRAYTLQYLDRIATNAILTNTTTWGTWSNLYIVDRVPFPQHFVIVDTTTNSRHRFYRLRASP